MPRHKYAQGSYRRRKRACSSSSSSSVMHNYNFKKAVLIRKPKQRSRSSTPTPSWKITCDRSHSYSITPLTSSSGTPPLNRLKQKVDPPMSARKLAAAMWEMNEILPSHGMIDEFEHREVAKRRERRKQSDHFRCLSQHLSDRSYSTASEKMNRQMKSNYRREPSIFRNHGILNDVADDVGYLDSASNPSFMELGSEDHTVRRSKSTIYGARNRLKEASNAVLTSRELLEVIDRVWTGHGPSPCATLFSALYTELERALLLINHAAYEECSSGLKKKKKGANYHHLMECLAAEKGERAAVEAAIGSVVRELEIERKLRRRLETLNKKLGRELEISRTSLSKTSRFLEVEKTNMEVMEHVRGATIGPVEGRKIESGLSEREPSDIHEDIIYDRTSLFLPFSQTETSRLKPAQAGATSSVNRTCGVSDLRPCPELGEEEGENGMLSEEDISENRGSRKWEQIPLSDGREDGGKLKQGRSMKKGLKEQIFSRLGYSGIFPK